MTQKHALVQGMNPRQEEAVLHTTVSHGWCW